MTGLRLAYLALALGLLTYGAILVGLGFRRPARPAGRPLRLVMIGALLLAAAGTAAAVLLEAEAGRPW